MYRRSTILAIVSFLFLTACGGDDGGDGMTGPAPTPPSIGGSWDYSFSNLSGSGVSCTQLTAGTLDISQSSATFSGDYFVGSIRCSGPGGTAEDGPFAGNITSGTVNADGEVSFNFDTSDWAHDGSVSGTSMSGTMDVELDLGGGNVLNLSGNWAASR